MNGRPTLADLEAFAAIAARRSFRQAADDLGLSPSTLSHMMRALENRMGVRLLHRTTRSVSPTEAGTALAGQAPAGAARPRPRPRRGGRPRRQAGRDAADQRRRGGGAPAAALDRADLPRTLPLRRSRPRHGRALRRHRRGRLRRRGEARRGGAERHGGGALRRRRALRGGRVPRLPGTSWDAADARRSRRACLHPRAPAERQDPTAGSSPATAGRSPSTFPAR